MATASVNVPVNQAIKEKDINSKLQLYGIFEAFSLGKVPSNKQIDVAMNSALDWKYMRNPSQKLSPEGHALVADLRNVIEQAKMLMLTKNSGNLLQDFIYQTQGIGKGDAQRPQNPLSKDSAKQDGQQALQGLRVLGNLLITNGQFRKLMSDSVILLREMAGDAASNAANRVNPTQEQLAQVDAPAESNTWHEKPDLSRDTLRNRVQSTLPIGKKDVQDSIGNAAQVADPSGNRDPALVAEQAAQDRQQGTYSGVDAVGGLRAGAEDLKSKASSNTSEERKQRLREYRARADNYFKGKMPKERRDQVIFRLKKMIVEIQGHEDYLQAVDAILRLAKDYHGHARNVASQSQNAIKGAHSQDTLKTAEADLKTLLERFANNTSSDDLIESINEVYRAADRDPDLKGWFRDLDVFIRKCLKEQGYILNDDSTEQWNRLYDRGNVLLRQRYKAHTDRVVDEMKFMAGQFDEDPQNKAFAQSLNKLFNDLGKDENGKPAFKSHLVKDLTEVLLPAFFEQVRYVPLPRIEYSDRQFDAVVENLVLEGDNLAPNVAEFGSDNFWRWGRRGNQNHNKNKVMLSVSGIQMDMRDIAYYIKRKEGFPGITDKGVMDIFLGGTGLSFKVAMETADKLDRQHFFKINNVTVDVRHMNIKLKQSNHKLLFALVKPLLLKVMRPILQKVAEKQIRDYVNKLDAMAWSIKQEADRAQQEFKANPDPEKAQSMYQRYLTAFQKQVQKGEKKKTEATADKQVKVAMTQNDSMFKHILLPGGISTKATEFQELAHKGDRWESPVFSIGSAQETTNLPAIGQPTRKRLGGGALAGGAAAGAAAGAVGGHSYGDPNAFSNQVGTAFQSDKSQDLGLTGAGAMGSGAGYGASNYGSTPSAGYSNAQAPTNEAYKNTPTTGTGYAQPQSSGATGYDGTQATTGRAPGATGQQGGIASTVANAVGLGGSNTGNTAAMGTGANTAVPAESGSRGFASTVANAIGLGGSNTAGTATNAAQTAETATGSANQGTVLGVNNPVLQGKV